MAMVQQLVDSGGHAGRSDRSARSSESSEAAQVTQPANARMPPIATP